MSNGSYDRRAPSAASQIITLERLLEESEERIEALETVCEEYDKMAVRSNEANARLLAENAKLREAAQAYEKELRETWDYEDEHIAALEVK